MSDWQIVHNAVLATGGSVPRFAALLDVHHSQVYRWLRGTTAPPRDVRRTCLAILEDPASVVAAYRAVAERAELTVAR
jgi:hypothetical protein